VSFDWWKALSVLDRAIVGGASLALFALFLPWRAVSGGLFPAVFSFDGWAAGFAAWAGGQLLGAAGVLLVLRRSSGSRAVVPIVSALGLVLVVVRWVSLPRQHTLTLGGSYSVGASYGIYLALIAGLAENAAAVAEITRTPRR
jgi:hypothetical protein